MANVITTWAEVVKGSYKIKLIDNGDGSYSLGTSGAGGFSTETPTDNGNGTYTFAHTPVLIFLEGVLGKATVDYTMAGLVCTPINPSGAGLFIQSAYLS